MNERIAEVAGAGLSGLAVATRLAQLGWRVRLHERNAELRMFGAGIWLWDNGLRSLEIVGAYDAAVARAKRIKEWRICDAKGSVLMSRPMSGTAAFNGFTWLYASSSVRLLPRSIRS